MKMINLCSKKRKETSYETRLYTWVVVGKCTVKCAKGVPGDYMAAIKREMLETYKKILDDKIIDYARLECAPDFIGYDLADPSTTYPHKVMIYALVNRGLPPEFPIIRRYSMT